MPHWGGDPHLRTLRRRRPSRLRVLAQDVAVLLVAVQLSLQILPSRRALALFAGLAAYGAALIAGPKLARTAPSGPSNDTPEPSRAGRPTSRIEDGDPRDLRES